MATSSDVFCGVCDASHITKYADYWCPECEEGLCSECQVHHSLLKVSRTHGMITIEQYQALPTSISEIVQHCKDHGLKYTNYCPNHDQLCCPNCISTIHGDCKGFMSVMEIIKTAKTSTLLCSMEQSLTDIDNNIEKVIQNRKNNQSNIRKQRQKFHDDLKKLRDKINSHLDDMEHTLITELDTVVTQVNTKIEKIVNRLSKERKSVQTLKNNLETLKKYGSDLQTFLAINMYQAEVEKEETYMKSLSEDGCLDEFNLTCKKDDKILDTLRSFTLGSISLETDNPSLILKTEKDKQAQILPSLAPKPLKDIKLSLLHAYNRPNITFFGAMLKLYRINRQDYRGCTIDPKGKPILTDHCRSTLVVVNDDGTVDRDISCSSYVKDVTTIDDRTIAVLTDFGIDIINIDSKQTEKVIKHDSNLCCGITHHKGSLLWCEKSKGIQRMDLSDESISTLMKQDQLPNNSYIAIHGDKIYQTNENTKSVTCYTTNGKRLWEYKNEAVLKDPTGITVDSNGMIYVTSYFSDNVVAISVDGKDGRQLLNYTDGLNRPFGIYFQNTNNNMLVVNRNGHAFLYHVS